MAQTVCVLVSTLDRRRLEMITTDRNRQRKHIERAQVILASAGGGPVQQIATQVGISRPMVWRWQQRFAEEGVDGLLRDKMRRPGKPRIAAETVACVVALTCTNPPHEARERLLIAVGLFKAAVPDSATTGPLSALRETAMRRRAVLAAAAGITAATPLGRLGRPALAQIAARTLRFVPAVALTSVDPLWSLATISYTHG